jgi:hypothetical protein
LSNHVLARVFDQKMNVIRGDHIIEHAKTETLLRLEQPVQVAAPIALSVSSSELKVRIDLLFP